MCWKNIDKIYFTILIFLSLSEKKYKGIIDFTQGDCRGSTRFNIHKGKSDKTCYGRGDKSLRKSLNLTTMLLFSVEHTCWLESSECPLLPLLALCTALRSCEGNWQGFISLICGFSRRIPEYLEKPIHVSSSGDQQPFWIRRIFYDKLIPTFLITLPNF